jgi:hypothetical protein
MNEGSWTWWCEGAVSCPVLLSVIAWLAASTGAAQGTSEARFAAPAEDASHERLLQEEEEARQGEGAEEEYRNALAFGFIYVHAFLKPRESPEGEPLRDSENLYGLNLVYDRTLIPNHLALAIAKPFVFNRERYDSPLEIAVKALIRRGQWEPFFALGVHNNFRFFSREREEQEGRRFEYAIGLLAATGFTFIVTPHWGVELELTYVYVFNERSVSQHEISPSLNAVYFFERGQRRSER